MRKIFGALAVVSALAISMPVTAAPRSNDRGIGVVHQILVKLCKIALLHISNVLGGANGTARPDSALAI